MRSRGCTYRQIAEALGYGDDANARRAVKRSLDAIPREAAEELKKLQLERLDYLTAKAIGVLEGTYYAVSQAGKVVTRTVERDGEFVEEPLYDSAPILHAIDRLVRIDERRSKLMGLDAPSRHEVITLDAIDAEIARLSAELDSAEAGETEEAP
jgi:hypothetical protein